LKQKP
jgi:starch synthase